MTVRFDRAARERINAALRKMETAAMNDASESTPRPWSLQSLGPEWLIFDADLRVVIQPATEELGLDIVTAVNERDALLACAEALRAVKKPPTLQDCPVQRHWHVKRYDECPACGATSRQMCPKDSYLPPPVQELVDNAFAALDAVMEGRK